MSKEKLYMHHVPGRLRIRCPLLKNNHEHAEHIVRSLQALPGVERCTISTVTGSVLCQYDPKDIEVEALITALHDLLPDPRSAPVRRTAPPMPLLKAPAPSHTRPVARAAASAFASPWQEKVAALVLEKAVERAVVMLVRAVL